MKVLDFTRYKGRQIHTCDHCGMTGVWTLQWSWWGSLRDEDNGKKLVKACSEECQAILSNRKLRR